MSSDNFLKYVVSFLVDKPEEVVVKEIDNEESSIFELRVAEGDVGKVIGKNGRIAKSLRTLTTASGLKNNKNYTLEIVD
ncbi:MAG: KH domain-containing protein [Leptospiraceae bacterium]|nr:KH domain-containing protein [Leptospiraceae bacterium]